MESVAKQLKKTNFTVRRVFDAQIKANVDTDLTMMQSWILLQMSKTNGPIYQKDLEKEFCIKKSSMSSTISLMEKKGYIIRVIDNVDKRQKALMMSDKAKELCDAIYQQILTTDKKIQSMLTPQEASVLIELLMKIQYQCEMEDKNG